MANPTPKRSGSLVKKKPSSTPELRFPKVQLEHRAENEGGTVSGAEQRAKRTERRRFFEVDESESEDREMTRSARKRKLKAYVESDADSDYEE